MLEGILHLNLFTVVIILYMVVILKEEKCLCRNLQTPMNKFCFTQENVF